jgi:hypothetical protein
VSDQLKEFLEGEGREGGALEKLISELQDQLYERDKVISRLEGKLAKRSKKPRKHLVIGDSHSSPDESNERYTWLGRFVVDTQPDVVIDIGDWADMPSLFRVEQNRGKLDFEGRRVVEDIECAREARALYAKELEAWPGDKPLPRHVSCMGNHEWRIARVLNDKPELNGLFSLEQLGAEEHGWEVHPFAQPVVVDGVAYCHFHTKGDLRFPISGVNAARSIIMWSGMSAVAGHSHKWDWHEQIRADHHKMFAGVVGCYFEREEIYAGPPQRGNWWRGLVEIDHIIDGYGQVRKHPIEQVKAQYGG